MMLTRGVTEGSVADSPPAAPSLRDLAAILEHGPHLTTDEADAFARDLADIAAEANRDGWHGAVGTKLHA